MTDVLFEDEIGVSILNALKEMNVKMSKLYEFETHAKLPNQHVHISEPNGVDDPFGMNDIIERSISPSILDMLRQSQQILYAPRNDNDDHMDYRESDRTSPYDDYEFQSPPQTPHPRSDVVLSDDEEEEVDQLQDEVEVEDTQRVDHSRDDGEQIPPPPPPLEDDEEDEWEDDNDLGYIMVQVSEEEFFANEEEAAFNMSLHRRININDDDDQEDDSLGRDNELDENSENDNREFWNDIEAVEAALDLNQGEGDVSRTENREEEPANDSEIHAQELEDGPEEESEIQFEETGLYIDEALEQEEVKEYTRRRASEDNRRSSEIWGQKKFVGVDGEHCFYNLKVIFDPFRTGFEEDKHFNPPPGTIVAGRYEVTEILGQAAFSTALQCVDLEAANPDEQWVCLKVIKNSKDFFDQSLDEIKLLQYINSKGDPNKHHVLRMIDYFYFKEHLFIVSELLRENLYEFGKYIRENNRKPYFTLSRLKRITKQVLEALVYIHSLRLIHCDIKPENIVIKSYSRCEVKLIDFGSSCFTTDHLTSYIQSRSYRAPEVILGLPYDTGIDNWSLGGVLAEMYTGYVLFQNDSLNTMLARIQGILGPYPDYMLQDGREVPKYFNMSNVIFEKTDEGIMYIYPKKTTLRKRLHIPPRSPDGEELTDEDLFVDFVEKMLQIDPHKRPSAANALLHPWLHDADTVDVTYIDDE